MYVNALSEVMKFYLWHGDMTFILPVAYAMLHSLIASSCLSSTCQTQSKHQNCTYFSSFTCRRFPYRVSCRALCLLRHDPNIQWTWSLYKHTDTLLSQILFFHRKHCQHCVISSSVGRTASPPVKTPLPRPTSPAALNFLSLLTALVVFDRPRNATRPCRKSSHKEKLWKVRSSFLTICWTGDIRLRALASANCPLKVCT